MTDNEIIVYEISGQQIARMIEDVHFYGYNDKEIADELIGVYGKDITINRVLYDEENIPCVYETIYDSDYQYEEEGEDDEEEDNRESEFEIYWDDLTEDCKKALLKAAGVKSPKEEMWDRFPVTIVYLD